MTQVEALYLANAVNQATPRSVDYPVTYGSLDAYAWPGGYPVFYLDQHNDVLCPACAQAIFEANRADALLRALGADADELEPCEHLETMRDAIGWESTRDVPVVYDAHWEGPPLTCEECQAEIESAYGDPDDEQPAGWTIID